MKKMIVLAVLLLIPAGVFAQPSGGNNPPGESMPASPSANPSGGHRKGGGRHAHIHKALNACSRAENQIRMAADDYGGHKEKAGELIRQAKEELKAALEYASQHKKQGRRGQGGAAGGTGGGEAAPPTQAPGNPQ